MLVSSLPTIFSSAVDQCNTSEETLYSFITLAMQKPCNVMENIDNLIKKAALSPEN